MREASAGDAVWPSLGEGMASAKTDVLYATTGRPVAFEPKGNGMLTRGARAVQRRG
ncbi:MAG: hypothetical protein ACRD0K_29645 [Egibacteraceae bacterium]